jgi:hypothetical protein
VPSFLRRLHPVTFRRADASGRVREAVVWTMPDYLAVGSDDDFVRVPLGRDEALAAARAFGASLPTRWLVDRIYDGADCTVKPQPLPPGPAMTSAEYLRWHEGAVAAELGRGPLAALVAGIKKDLVLTPRLARHPDRVAIYGWHRENGRPIQPLSSVHGKAYADYSHGVRLVSATVLLDGEPRSLLDLLADPLLAPVVSDEGVDGSARCLVAG